MYIDVILSAITFAGLTILVLFICLALAMAIITMRVVYENLRKLGGE